MLDAKRIESTIQPQKILKLNDGTFYYNYDIKSRVVTVIDESGVEKEETRYNYVQVQLRGVPSYALCAQAIIRAYITEDQEFELINKHAAQGVELAEDNEKDYEQYLALLKEIKYKVKVDFNLIPADPVEEAKSKKIFEINAYDSSSAVNEFTYQGVSMWLDKETRNGLLMRLNAEKAAGKTQTTLWFGTLSFTLDIDSVFSMIYALEVYASECYDRTAAHKAAVNTLTTVEAIEAYDYTTGYPSKLVF